MKKAISVLFVVCIMAICLLSLPSRAQAATVAEGVCGDDLTWCLDDAGTLTVSGTGDMATSSAPPWEEWKDQIINIIIEPGVTSISEYAFYTYENIKTLTVPESINAIGYCAFAGCANLESVYISNLTAWCNTYFGYEYANPLRNSADLYLNGELVTKLVIPDDVSRVANYAFYGCESLVYVTIPEGVTTIGNSAFCHSAIKAVSLPESITYIGQTSFNSCTDLDHIAFTGTQSQWEAISMGNYNYSISNATLHYETVFTDADNCMDIGAYCPVCDLYITAPKKDAIAHTYAGIGDDVCDVCNYTRKLTSAYIRQLPDKLGYCLDESLDITGGLLKLVYEDGDSGTIAFTEDMVSGFDGSVEGVQHITVTYKGFTDTYPTEVVSVMPQYAHISNLPTKTSYMTGNALDLTNINFYVGYKNGPEYTGYKKDVQCWADTSTAGAQTAVVLYRGVKKTFTIYVHDRQLDYMHESQPHPESDHNYANNIDITESVGLPVAEELVLVFDENSATEEGRDFIYIYDKNRNLIGKYSGNLANLEVAVPGTTAYIRLTSDSANTAYGYKIKAVKVYRSVHLEEAIPDKPSTCDGWGYTGRTICSLCNQTLNKGSNVRPYGHSYGEWVVARPSTAIIQGRREKTCAECGTIFWESLPLLEPVAEWNVALSDELQVNFYLRIEEEFEQTARAFLTIGDETETYNISGLTKSENGYYLLQKNISAAQMNENIAIHLNQGDIYTDPYIYSVRDYCDTILADESYAEYHALVKEMLNYGAAAQIYFDHDAENLANEGITDVAAAEVPETVEEMTVDGEACDVAFYGASLVYRDRIAVRYYFTGNVTGCTFTANGNTFEPVAKNGMYYVEIPDILPQNLDQQITLTVTDAEANTLSVTYGPMNYIVRMNQKDDEKLKNLLKALYNYHLAAKALLENT